MIAKAVGQLLLAVSLFHVAPIDAAVLESKVVADEVEATAPRLFLGIGKAHLPQADEREIPPPKKNDAESFGVATSADSVIVLDKASGATLYAENPDDVRPMGSITKLMSAMVFLDSEPALSEFVTLEEEDYAGTGRVFLRFNDPVSLKGILGAALVGSDNTAAESLPRLMGITPEEFVEKMNVKADELGLTETVFVDPSGLSANNMSTARELAVILKRAQTYGPIAEFMSTSVYRVTQSSGFAVDIPSTNLLLTSALENDEYDVRGGKTGFIPQAGYCLATVVEHEGDEVIIVVLGAEGKDDRFTDASALAVWSFKTFVWPNL